MQGQIIVENINGRRWIHVAEARIQFQVQEGGSFGLIIAAFRTDGYHGQMLTLDYLKQTCQFTSLIDVPKEIVEFAVRSERRRQESVFAVAEAIADSAHLDKVLRSETIMDMMASTKPRANDELLEYQFALIIQKLLNTTSGLQ